MANNVLYDELLKKKQPKLPADNWMNQESFTPRTDLTLKTDTPIPVTAPTNLLTAASTAPIPAQDSLSDYWEQPVGGTKIPLDQFVRLAGMAAKAIAPQTAGGRLGGDLATMGGQMYGERMRREYETPNRLLRQKLLSAQIKEIENKRPGMWEALSAAHPDKPVEELIAMLTEAKAVPDRTLTAYKTFYRSQKAAGKTDAEIDVAWTKRQEQIAVTKKKDDKTLVKIQGPDGKIIYVPREEAIGMEAPVSVFKPTTETERTYQDYKAQWKASGGEQEGLPRTEAGKMMSSWEFKKFMAPVGTVYMTPVGLAAKNQAGQLVSTQDGHILTDEEAAGATSIPKPESNIEKSIREAEEAREAEKGKGILSTIGGMFSTKPELAPETEKYTEAQLRSLLVEKKKTDSSVDIEKAMKYYKSIGKY